MSQTKEFCNKCRVPTHHDIVAVENGPTSSDDLYCTYEMIKCRGCSCVRLRTLHGNVGEEPNFIYYAPQTVQRAMPYWASSLASQLIKHAPAHVVCCLMEEVYVAFENLAFRLAAMGIRAALETMMVDKIGDQGSFKRNIDAFNKAGYISERQAHYLDSVIDAGSAASHRGWEPSEEDLNRLLDISEAVIADAYLHEFHAVSIEAAVPRRLPRGKDKP